MPKHCNAVFFICVFCSWPGNTKSYIKSLKKNNSFFLNIILSHVLHSCLGLIEIYEYENKQKSSSWCYSAVKSLLRSILNFTCNFWFCHTVWMKLCSADQENTFLRAWGSVVWLQGRLSYRPICSCSPLPGPPLGCVCNSQNSTALI